MNKKKRPGWVAHEVSTGRLTLLILLVVILRLVMWFAGKIWGIPVMHTYNYSSFWLMFWIYHVLGPFSEEATFRLTIIFALRRWGWNKPTFVSAGLLTVAWAAAHGIAMIWEQVIVGALLMTLFLKAGILQKRLGRSYLACVIAHSLLNMVVWFPF